jgi:hypothetical protein
MQPDHRTGLSPIKAVLAFLAAWAIGVLVSMGYNRIESAVTGEPLKQTNVAILGVIGGIVAVVLYTRTRLPPTAEPPTDSAPPA